MTVRHSFTRRYPSRPLCSAVALFGLFARCPFRASDVQAAMLPSQTLRLEHGRVRHARDALGDHFFILRVSRIGGDVNVLSTFSSSRRTGGEDVLQTIRVVCVRGNFRDTTN